MFGVFTTVPPATFPFPRAPAPPAPWLYCSAATLGVLINKLEGHEPGVVQLVQQLAPDDPGEIADEAFSGCEALARVDIPAAVETIGSYAFSGCDGLETIVLPPSVKEIGDWAFLGW